MQKSLFDVVRSASLAGDEYNKSRQLNDIFNHVVEEVGELSTEIIIAEGRSYKPPGKDGIVGEGVDIILAVLDLIYKHDPNVTEEQLVAIAEKKCGKWIQSLIDHPIKHRP